MCETALATNTGYSTLPS